MPLVGDDQSRVLRVLQAHASVFSMASSDHFRASSCPRTVRQRPRSRAPNRRQGFQDNAGPARPPTHTHLTRDRRRLPCPCAPDRRASQRGWIRWRARALTFKRVTGHHRAWSRHLILHLLGQASCAWPSSICWIRRGRREMTVDRRPRLTCG
jgi:hypothetical protein